MTRVQFQKDGTLVIDVNGASYREYKRKIKAIDKHAICTIQGAVRFNALPKAPHHRVQWKTAQVEESQDGSQHLSGDVSRLFCSHGSMPWHHRQR